MMSDVYISYAREEMPRARELANALEESGFTVWWDHKIAAGETWAKLIEGALNTAKCVVVLWSNASVKSPWVREEAAYAQEGDKLLPVVVENTRIPLGFGHVDSADLSEWKGELTHPEFQRLVAGIKHLLDR
jgi:TIR domain